MYQVFNLSLRRRDFGKDQYVSLVEKAREGYNAEKKNFGYSLSKYAGKDSKLDGDQMLKDWFPQVHVPIFLSHSHADEDLALALASWLKETFNLDCFIDSMVWEHTTELINSLNKTYHRDSATGRVSYSDVLVSASHAHTMLTMSLMNMLDKTDAVFFLNTPNSVSAKTLHQEKTTSPWLFAELAMTKSLRREQRFKTKHFDNVNESQTIEYTLDTEHLTTINTDDLCRWRDAWQKRGLLDASTALDVLYRNVFVQVTD